MRTEHFGAVLDMTTPKLVLTARGDKSRLSSIKEDFLRSLNLLQEVSHWI